MAFIYVNSDARLPVPSDDEIARHTAKIHGPAPEVQPVQGVLDIKRPVRLAIASLGFADEEPNRKVADLTLADLTGAKGLELVERQSLEKLLQEMNLSLSGLVRARDAVRVGKLIRADWFLLGSPVSLNGTNYIVVRVVDGRTGMLRDAGVFDIEPSPTRIATNLAAFVRQCRQNAAEAKSRIYLAIGSFEDLSLNSRQAALPAQLRSYLTAAYQGANVTLLEREFANTLLQEVRLDLAGLTDEAGADAPVIQSAYWMVDGYYQSYETTEFEVELVLHFQRMFGKRQEVALREKPGQLLFQRVKASIDEVMQRDKSSRAPTRLTELRAQLYTGRELLDSVKASRAYNSGYDWIDFTGELSVGEVARLRRNTEEAVRAFETVLLLDPNHREAKIWLADCFKKPFIRRVDEARELYRIILEEPVSDKWTGIAQRELVWGLQERSGPEEARDWFQKALQRNANKSMTEFYRHHAGSAANEVTIQQGEGTKAIELAEQRLLERIRSMKSIWEGGSGRSQPNFGMDSFQEAFGGDKQRAAQHLVEFLPRMKAEFPELTPYLLASVLTVQVTPNAQVLQEFEQALDECIEHPTRVFHVQTFWQETRWSVYDWCFRKTNYVLAVKFMEGERRAAAEGHVNDFKDQEKIKLAYAYLATQRWKQALEVFESFSGKTVQTEGGGPWGKAFYPIPTDKMAAYCRDQLGMVVARNSREFDMGRACICLHEPSAFALDADGVWIGIGNQLLHLHFDLQTNVTVRLPVNAPAPITSVCVGSSKLWIGTDGEGLIEMDKATQKCVRLTEKDGLMMDHISHLHLAKNALWIGYGNKTGGGLGRFELASRRLTSFTPSLVDNSSIQNKPAANGSVEKREQPPRQRVGAIVTDPDENVWLLVNGASLRRYQPREDVWQTVLDLPGGCLFADSDHLILGQNLFQYIYAYRRTDPCELGVSVMNLKDGKRSVFQDAQGLPCSAVTAMCLDGQNLWLGGSGFIAMVDATKGSVRKFAHITARGVDQIGVGGGYVWAKFDRHLYRAPQQAAR